MKQQPGLSMVDDLARLAGDAEPPALDDVSTHRMLDVAMRSSATPTRVAASPRRWPVFAMGAVAVAALALLVMFALPSRDAAEPALMRVTLPTGDRLVGTSGAQFAIEELAPASRRLRVQSGALVFDVAKVATAQRFEVATMDTVVVATGTVFSVGVTREATDVHVFEGSVDVLHATQRIRLVAGSSWSSRTSRGHLAPITAAGEAFARERLVASSTPSVAPPPEPVPLPQRQPEPHRQPDPEPQPHRQPDPEPHPQPEPQRQPHRQPEPQRQPHRQPAATVASPPSPPPMMTAPTAIATIDAARADIIAGRYTDALTKAAATERTGTSGEWDLVRGDALRALRRTSEAISAFESAAKSLDTSGSRSASYTAAYVAFHDLRDAERALVNLTGVDDKGSPFEERALVLRAQVLVALGRKHEAAVSAARYLDRFPKGSSTHLMRGLSKTD